jgi:hypothetical protein
VCQGAGSWAVVAAGCLSLIQLDRWRIEPQCLVEGHGELLSRHRIARREQWREARDQPLHGFVPAGDRRRCGLDNFQPRPA